MPELPDVTVYVEALSERILGKPLERIRLGSPFVLRSVSPPLAELHGKTVESVRRLGKRIVLGLEGDLYLVIHLMVAGRFQWKPKKGAPVPGRVGLAAFDFPDGTLTLTEASKKKRASIHAVAGAAGLAEHDRGGAEPLEIDRAEFVRVLTSERHTLKRSLTDPTLFSGIGNAYSDEILHRAQLSPVTLTDKLDDDALTRLYTAVQSTLTDWTARLREERAGGFPEKVTAFRAEMAVHGKYGKPCPVCQTPVQRIRYAENETNYCPRCQTGGKLLADRGLSRLLKSDWPRTVEALEARRRGE